MKISKHTKGKCKTVDNKDKDRHLKTTIDYNIQKN